MSGAPRVVALLVVTAVVVTGCGRGGEQEASVSADEDPFEAVERATPDPDAPRRAAPRWEEVAALSGEGSATEEFPIAEDALQWRANWRCESGELRLQVDIADEPLLAAD